MTEKIKNPHLPTGCCIPFIRPWPSGRAWTHSAYCVFAPNQKFTPQERDELTHHQGVHRVEREKEVETPAPRIHDECRKNAGTGGIVCASCSPYIRPSEYDMAHSDDNDDREASDVGR